MTNSRNRRSISALLALLLYVLIAPHALAAAPAPLPKTKRESRYGVFFLGNRIGSSTLVETPERFRGKPALKVDSSTRIKIVALGEVEQNVDLVQYLGEDWSPVHLRFHMTSSGHTTRVEADFFPDRVECQLDAGGTKSKKTIPIPKGVSLVADPNLLGDRGLKVGEKQKLYLFEPLTLQVLPLDVEVLREEKFPLGGKTYPATVLKTVNSLTGESTSWVTQDGQLLQGDAALGIRMLREEGPVAANTQPDKTTGAYVPPVDLAVATAVKTETKLPDPRKTSYLKVRISGIPERRLILSDARQRVSPEEQEVSGGRLTGFTAVYEIGGTAPPPPLRIGEGGPNNDPRQYLKEAPYLEVKDARIQKQAREIVGKEKDAGKKAELIRAWVHGRMKADTSIGVPRSATDVLKTPRGVCRDYSVLFAALARAAGVPTRICGGTIYFRDSFYYHAWNECLVDPERDTWRAFDATLPTDFVDATHIKFAQGDATDMFQAVRVVGQLKAEILEYR
jgi:hypothetical protein